MITVNPHDRFDCPQRFVFWFGEVAPLRLVVWGSDLTSTLHLAAAYLAVHAPNHLMLEGGLEHRALLRETAIEAGIDPRHFEGLQVDAAAADEDADLNPFDDEPGEPTPPLGILDSSVRDEILWAATGALTATAWGFLDPDDWGTLHEHGNEARRHIFTE